MTKVTIVVPTQNSQQWIIETLESVRAQTYPRENIETIVVDDGSNDASAALARWFLERHGMKGAVLVADQTKGIGAALNVGWRAATGDWVQFIKGQDLLAPNKIELQVGLIPQLPEDVRVICSSWQRRRLCAHQWQVVGPVSRPDLTDPIVLKLVASRVGPLGAALFRRKSIQTVAGFSEETTYAVDEHFLLKMAGMGESARPSNLCADLFAEAPSSSPLFFEREDRAAHSRHWKVGFARQHLENVLIARTMLRENQRGLLTPVNIQQIAFLCNESLRDLLELDRAAFEQCSQWLRDIDPSYLPTQPTKPRSTDMVVSVRRWVASGAATLASARSSWVVSLRHGLDRASHMLSDLIQTVTGAGARLDATFGLTAPKHRLLAKGALVVIAATVLLGGIFTLYPYRNSAVVQLHSAQRVPGGVPTINVATTIYAEPMSSWPLPVEIGPSQWVSPDGALHVSGLPPTITLSEGRRVSADVWAVPLLGLSNLELLVAKSGSGKSNLALSLVAADGGILAEARTAISIQETGPRAQIPGTLPEPTAPTAKQEPPRQRADPSAIELPAPLPTTKPSSEQDAVQRGPKVASEPVGSTATPAPVESPPLMAPAKLDAVAAVAALAEGIKPSPARMDELDHKQVATPKAPAVEVQHETKIASTTLPDASRSTATSVPAEPPMAIAKFDQSLEPARLILTQEARLGLEKMIARGERNLADGNVAAARQFFLRAAEAGIARGALLLASTYDPHEFVQLRIQGVQPNPAVARKWYTRARELGAALADERLFRLGAAN
jgi:glycosyltransferase involved in cell wall biosynthesis